MWKQISLILCILMIFSGCGSSSKATSSILETKYQSIREQKNTTNKAETNTDETDKEKTEKPVEAKSDEPLKIGFCQVGAESGWREAHTNSMKEMFTVENGYNLQYVDGNGDQNVQIQAIKDFIKNKVSAIVLAPVVETGWDEVLKEAKAAKIPVIIVDRMIKTSDESLYACWVGSNFKTEGTNAIDWLISYMDKKGTGSANHKVVMLQGTMGASAEIGRTEGVREGLSKHSNYELIFEKSGDFTKDGGKKVMTEFLATNKEFDVLISQNDDMTFGAIEAMKAAGINPGKDVTVVSFDGGKNAFQCMVNGEINGEIECNPLQGPFVSELIQKILANENVDKIQYMYESVYDESVAAQEIGNRAY